MHPPAHLETQLRTHRRKRLDYYLANILGLILLLFVSILVAPLLHEFLHMFFLDVNHKPYTYQIDFDWGSGITGEIKPFSALSINESIILLGIGVFSNLLIAVFLFLRSWKIRIRGRMPESILSTYLAVGFVYNPMIYFMASEGDLVNILMLMDMQNLALLLPLIGLSFMILVCLYINEHAKHAFSEYYFIVGEIERLEGLLLPRLSQGIQGS